MARYSKLYLIDDLGGVDGFNPIRMQRMQKTTRQSRYGETIKIGGMKSEKWKVKNRVSIVLKLHHIKFYF